MATCPYCLGPLSDGHRCLRRRGWRTLRRAVVPVGGALLVVCGGYGLVERPHGAVALAAALLGGLLADAAARAISSRV